MDGGLSAERSRSDVRADSVPGGHEAPLRPLPPRLARGSAVPFDVGGRGTEPGLPTVGGLDHPTPARCRDSCVDPIAGRPGPGVGPAQLPEPVCDCPRTLAGSRTQLSADGPWRGPRRLTR